MKKHEVSLAFTKIPESSQVKENDESSQLHVMYVQTE